MHSGLSMPATGDADPLDESTFSGSGHAVDNFRVRPSEDVRDRSSSCWELSGPNNAKVNRCICNQCFGASPSVPAEPFPS